ncbi:MAG: hypothetical protein H6618_08085 [Deltaproteobacteria bacterium]|nr:hypothetical protein [Deltaproteobacteria bacterium]
MACLSGFLLMAGLLIVGCRTHQKGTASGMSPDELQTEASDEGWKIDPDSVQAEFALVPGELNEKKVLRLVAVDEKQSFLRYRVCQTEASCSEKELFFTDGLISGLPEGDLEISIQLCYHRNQTQSGKSSCSPWTEPLKFHQDASQSADMDEMISRRNDILADQGKLFLSYLDSVRFFRETAAACPGFDPEDERIRYFSEVSRLSLGDLADFLLKTEEAADGAGLALTEAATDQRYQTLSRRANLGSWSATMQKSFDQDQLKTAQYLQSVLKQFTGRDDIDLMGRRLLTGAVERRMVMAGADRAQARKINQLLITFHGDLKRFLYDPAIQGGRGLRRTTDVLWDNRIKLFDNNTYSDELKKLTTNISLGEFDFNQSFNQLKGSSAKSLESMHTRLASRYVPPALSKGDYRYSRNLNRFWFQIKRFRLAEDSCLASVMEAHEDELSRVQETSAGYESLTQLTDWLTMISAAE